MRAVIQRVSQASVAVEGTEVGRIGPGLVVLLAVGRADRERDLEFLSRKILNLRIFPDDEGKMNRSLLQVNGQLLVVSQFTLLGDCRKGNRPSYSRAAPPEAAQKLYQRFIEEVRRQGVTVRCGRFQAMMQVSLINDGPVTLILDSSRPRKSAHRGRSPEPDP